MISPTETGHRCQSSLGSMTDEWNRNDLEMFPNGWLKLFMCEHVMVYLYRLIIIATPLVLMARYTVFIAM